MIPDKCPKCGAKSLTGTASVWGCGNYHARPPMEHEPWECLERQRDQLAADNTALRERVKRLEEAGDYWIPRDSDAQEAWAKAK